MNKNQKNHCTGSKDLFFKIFCLAASSRHEHIFCRMPNFSWQILSLELYQVTALSRSNKFKRRSAQKDICPFFAFKFIDMSIKSRVSRKKEKLMRKKAELNVYQRNCVIQWKPRAIRIERRTGKKRENGLVVNPCHYLLLLFIRVKVYAYLRLIRKFDR